MALSKIDVANMVTGATPVANGGTGLTSGTTNQFLKFTGNTTLASAADNDTGKVLQIKTGSKTDTASNTSTSASNLISLPITPSSTSSKILVQCNVTGVSANNLSLVFFQIVRESTVLIKCSTSGQASSANAFLTMGGNNTSRDQKSGAVTYLDSPSSSSEITYYLKWFNENGSHTWYINRWGENNDAGSVTTLSLIELGA
jgi:hypothetical protein